MLRGRVDVLARSQTAAINTRFKIGTILEVKDNLELTCRQFFGFVDTMTRTVNGTGHTGPSEFCAMEKVRIGMTDSTFFCLSRG